MLICNLQVKWTFSVDSGAACGAKLLVPSPLMWRHFSLPAVWTCGSFLRLWKKDYFSPSCVDRSRNTLALMSCSLDACTGMRRPSLPVYHEGEFPPPPKKVIVNHKGTWQFKVIRRASRVSQKVFSWFRLFICGYFLDPYSWILNCKLSSSCFLFSIVTYSHFLPKVAMYACFNESIFHLFISLI